MIYTSDPLPSRRGSVTRAANLIRLVAELQRCSMTLRDIELFLDNGTSAARSYADGMLARKAITVAGVERKNRYGNTELTKCVYTISADADLVARYLAEIELVRSPPPTTAVTALRSSTIPVPHVVMRDPMVEALFGAARVQVAA